MNLDKYLEHIESSGMSFAMDSFGFRKRKKVRRGIYDENYSLESGTQRALIDFDGPIHKYSQGYMDGELYDKPSEGAKEFIDWLKSKGYQIVIFTTRASKINGEETGSDYKKEIIKVEDYLEKYRIYYDLITAEKLAANFYIDDRAIHFNNWKTVKDEVTKRMKL